MRWSWHIHLEAQKESFLGVRWSILLERQAERPGKCWTHTHKSTILWSRRNTNTQGKYDTGCTGKHFQGSWVYDYISDAGSSSPLLFITKALIQTWPTEDLSLGHFRALVYFPLVQKHSRGGQTKDWEWEGITGIGKDRDGVGRGAALGVCMHCWMVGG